MLIDKNELICLVDAKLEEFGLARLNSFIYDIETKIDSFDVLTLSRILRMLSSYYNFEYLSLTETDVLEQINLILNEN